MVIWILFFIFFLQSDFLYAATPRRPHAPQPPSQTPVFHCGSQYRLRRSLVNGKLLLTRYFGLPEKQHTCVSRTKPNVVTKLPPLQHRIMYGVDLDPDSIVIDMADGTQRRYPNKAYALDSRIAELYHAVAHRSLESVKAIIAQGVDYIVCENFRTTLLMHACGGLRPEIVEYLLTLPNIDVNAQDVMGYTALYFVVDAATKEGGGECEDFVKRVEKIIFLLKKAGANFECKPNRELGRTALELALSRSHKNRSVIFVVHLLLQAGVSDLVAPLYQLYLNKITRELKA